MATTVGARTSETGGSSSGWANGREEARTAAIPPALRWGSPYAGSMSGPQVCRRCGKPVVASAAHHDVFEQMHYVCFHYQFEHDGDPDVECLSGGCPSSGPSVSSRLFRIEGVDLFQAGNTVVPAILALRALGFVVEQQGDGFVARTGSARFSADDPVAVLGLVKLAESRRPWRATDSEIDEVLAEFDR